VKRNIGMAVLGGMLAVSPAFADTRDDVFAAMQRCAVFQDDRTWLDCTYGAQQLMRAKLGLPPAPAYQQHLVPAPSLPASVAAAARNAATAAPPVHHRGGFFQILGGTAPPVAVSTLASVAYDSQGAFIVTLQNGQIWRQANADTDPKPHLRVGSRVTITPGALWTYNLTTDDNPHSYKVERKT
jgi:hypothetical protein